jgi:cytochrome c oxidase subunit 2
LHVAQLPGSVRRNLPAGAVQHKTQIAAALLFASPFPANASDATSPLGFLNGYGDKADPVVQLTWGLLLISIAVVAIIALLVTASVMRGRAQPLAEPGTRLSVAREEGGLNWLWVGVGLSTLALLFSVVWTMEVIAKVNAAPSKPALTIEVTGHQWWWEVHYDSADPSRVFTTANEIHIPTGVPVAFKLIGADVIHSFWVPKLSGKTDMIPGQTNTMWLEASRPGIYRGQCTEYCGAEHALMKILVVAQSPAEFKAWWNKQLQSPAAPASGQSAAGQIAFRVHCGSCHSVRGTDAMGILGPDLSHIASRRMIAANTYPNTPENLTKWISDPQGLKPQSLMQKPELAPNELADIRSYVETLK